MLKYGGCNAIFVGEGERQFLKGMMGMPMFKRSMAVLLVIMAVAAGVTMWEMYDGDEVQMLADNRLSAGDEQAGKTHVIQGRLPCM